MLVSIIFNLVIIFYYISFITYRLGVVVNYLYK